MVMVYRTVIAIGYANRLCTHGAGFWHRLFFLGIFLTGIGWGLSSWLMFPEQEVANQFVLLLTLAGICAAAVATLSADFRQVVLVVAMSIVPAVLRLVLQGGPVSTVVAFMSIIFFAFMLISGYRMHLTIIRNIKLGIKSDARERVRRESDDRFRRLSELTREGIFVENHGRIVDVNRAGSELFGYTAEEFQGMDIVSLAAPEGVDMVQTQIENKTKEAYEAFLQRKNGDIFPCGNSGKKHSL